MSHVAVEAIERERKAMEALGGMNKKLASAELKLKNVLEAMKQQLEGARAAACPFRPIPL